MGSLLFCFKISLLLFLNNDAINDLSELIKLMLSLFDNSISPLITTSDVGMLFFRDSAGFSKLIQYLDDIGD